jgi:hypothetical protein
MSFWQFVFSFLFVRNWHSGQWELSRPRVALFLAGLAIVLLGSVLALILGAPIVYEVPQ